MIAPASTGKANSSRKEVARIASRKVDVLSSPIRGGRTNNSVTRKLIAPDIDDTPARCKEKHI